MSWFTDLERRGYARPTSLRREIRRFLLIRRAKRVKFEREMAELTDFLDAIRESNGSKQLRKIYADDVG